MSYVLVGFSILQIVILFKLFKLRSNQEPSLSPFQDIELRLKDINSQVSTLSTTQVDTNTKIEGLPITVLRTIQGSVNQTTGKLGELIQFIELQRSYDRLIPVGSIVDFIAVKFPTKESPGSVTFIDIKTGRRAVLSKDQKALRAIIESQNIEFRTVKVEIT